MTNDNQNISNIEIESLSNITNNNVTNNQNTMAQKASLNELSNAPVIPMEDNTKEDDLFSMDLQKELEAKFDELFGPIENTNNKTNNN